MATINSNGTGGGNSDDTASWSGGVVPVDGDKVNIVSPDTITMQATHVWGDDTTTAINIKTGGTLKASRSASSSLTCKGSLIGESGGEIDYGKSGDEIGASYTHDLILNFSDTLSDGEFGFHAKDGFDVYMWGSDRNLNALTTNQITAAGNQVDVDDVTGWAIGDKVVLATTGSYSAKSEYDIMEIQSIASNTVTFTGNVTYTHLTGCRIGNFSSNVTIKPYDINYQPWCWFEHSSTSSASTRHIEHVSFRQIGSNTALAHSGVFFDGNNQQTKVWSGVNSCSFIKEASSGGNDYTLTIFDNEAAVPFADTAIMSLESSCIWVGQGAEATFSGGVSYYTTNWGVTSGYSEGGVSCEFSDFTIIGATGGLQGTGNGWTITDCTFLALAYPVYFTHGAKSTCTTCTFGETGMTNQYSFAVGDNQATCQVDFIDCTFATPSTSELFNVSNVTSPVFEFRVANRNVDPSLQEVHKGAGSYYRDNSTYKTGVASLRFEPNNSSLIPLTLDFKIFAPTGKLVVVSGFIRKNSSYGSSTLPSVTLKGLGITNDTSTMTDVDDTWWQFKVAGTQTTGTDGMLTLTVSSQSSGAGAKSWIDGIVSATPDAINSGDFGFWANGQPVQAIAANFVSGLDVWNVLHSEVTLTGSIGQMMKHRRYPNR